MPFKSKAQRRLFYAKATNKEMPWETVREWEAATPDNAKLPDHVKKAYDLGMLDALNEFKVAVSKEIRLKMRHQSFHGMNKHLGIKKKKEKE